MGHIRLTGNTIEHDTSDSVMLSNNDKAKDKLINALNDTKKQLKAVEDITKGVSDTTSEINDYLDKNYKTYEELYKGGSPLVKEFVRTVKTTYISGPDQSSHEFEETGSTYRDDANDFAKLISNDSRLISVEINELPVQHYVDIIDDYTQILTDVYKIEVIVEYNS